MADETGASGESDFLGGGVNEGGAGGVISHSLKDLSFENPAAPAVFQWQGQPQIDIQFNIGAAKVGEDVHEVTLRVEATAVASEGTAFKVDVLYAGLFAIRNMPEEQLQPFLLAEAPRILFPFARRVIADCVREGGFPPLMLDPIDFASLYMQRQAQMQAEQTGSQIGGTTGQA
jgi:preprotein translocase subunit SecB